MQSGALQLPPGHSMDAFGQWTLWAKRESLDTKKFTEEYVNLVSKNYKFQNKKFDGPTKAKTEESAGQLFTAAQHILTGLPKSN